MRSLRLDYRKHKYLYLMIFPVLLYYVLFHYVPMYGALIAFKDYRVAQGFMDSPWVGFKHFQSFFDSYYFVRLLKNTLLLNVYQLLFAFPAPILFALLINEIGGRYFKRMVQTITYLPHFISLIIVCGMITQFVAREGVITDLLVWFGMERTALLAHPEYFRTVYIASDIWQSVGWGSIIYLAAITGINPELYEAAKIDGANRWKQTLNISLPGIAPIIIILFILKIGHMLDIGFEKIILLYNPNTYVTADVINTFVYRKGLGSSFEFSYATAVGLFQSAVNFLLLIVANKISRKLSESSLW
ncbi:ABC transporter permease subunit [Paenibacillus sp. LMG 31456]|uniref:ABC transporter permease subunit n=1 Tax=Paenibacillus foliorum TaxID=2654974 RepID=A0A972K3D2_9BACL|nr:ABC transporter permease subunit [Paenibacillus foliorum]NOU95783.1 ABC transporter permease subunit [Paenibacillus foliorum]